MTSNINPVYAAALDALDAGISVVPPAEDGTKQPLTTWKLLQRRHPTRGQLHRWYADHGHTGVGVICGEVSGGLILFEFEDRPTYEAFKVAAAVVELGDLVHRIEAGYLETTPGGGLHWLFRCPEVERNTKLARRPKRPEEMRDEHDKLKVLIETREERGYAITAPSNGRVHPTGGPYMLLGGGFATIATITAGERADLYALARTFDELPKQAPPEPRSGPVNGGTRPGDDFNDRADWHDILEPAGWTWVYRRGEVEYWRRPGKDRGVSATTNHAGSGYLYVFSTSTPFEAERGYSPFSAYAVLEHGGDFAAATRALADQGYGAPHATAPPPSPSGHLGGGSPPEATIPSPEPAWPALNLLALHGVAGDFVRTVAPQTEADPVALLLNLVVMFGNACGRTPHTIVGSTRHGTNLTCVQVGSSSKARKGTAEAPPRRLMQVADEPWLSTRVVSGLSSGEGLIWAVRDPIERTEPIKEKGRIIGYQAVTVDPGVGDKRLLVIEEEFASVLKVASREGNTLSPVMRLAWDGKDLRAMTKNSPATASAPHVSIMGHITQDELLRHLDSTEAANGQGNRILWVCVRRANILPEGGELPQSEMDDLGRRLRSALDTARRRGTPLTRDAAAKALWAEVYPDLSEGQPGLFGAVTSRAEAQVLRLSLLYALLDEAEEIHQEHVAAALALWDYCEASARYIFGDATGNPVADRILRALRTNGPMTQNDLVDLFGRNVRAGQLERALEALVTARLVFGLKEETGGRPKTVWSAAP